MKLNLTKDQVITNPPDNWLERLRTDHYVWLAKENRLGQIGFPYEPPEPGYLTGYIGVKTRTATQCDNGNWGYPDNLDWGHIERWHISSNGRGIDGSQLLLPLEGNLPENPPELPTVESRHINQQLDRLNQRVRQLERIVNAVMDPLVVQELLIFLDMRDSDNDRETH
jgi:hypothetical protein